LNSKDKRKKISNDSRGRGEVYLQRKRESSQPLFMYEREKRKKTFPDMQDSELDCHRL
jgi:hypothetical protein